MLYNMYYRASYSGFSTELRGIDSFGFHFKSTSSSLAKAKASKSKSPASTNSLESPEP